MVAPMYGPEGGSVYSSNLNLVQVGYNSSIVTERIADPLVGAIVSELGTFAYFQASEREGMDFETLLHEKKRAATESGIQDAVEPFFKNLVSHVVVGKGGAFKVIMHREPSIDIIPAAQPKARTHFGDIAQGPWLLLRPTAVVN